jgi:hypothetical protein
MNSELKLVKTMKLCNEKMERRTGVNRSTAYKKRIRIRIIRRRLALVTNSTT